MYNIENKVNSFRNKIIYDRNMGKYYMFIVYNIHKSNKTNYVINNFHLVICVLLFNYLIFLPDAIIYYVT